MWLPIHDTLLTHPKLFRLMKVMKFDSDHAIAALLRFWWWCLDYAPDGDLRRYSSTELGAAAGLSGDQADRFPGAMLEAGFLDEIPYFRIHDWWDYAGPLFRAKHKRQPQVWKRIRDLYEVKPSEDLDGDEGEG